MQGFSHIPIHTLMNLGGNVGLSVLPRFDMWETRNRTTELSVFLLRNSRPAGFNQTAAAAMIM